MKAEFLSYFLMNYFMRASKVNITESLEKILKFRHFELDETEKTSGIDAEIQLLQTKFDNNPPDLFLNKDGLDINSNTYKYLSDSIVTSLKTARIDHGINHAFFSVCDSMKDNVEQSKSALIQGYSALSSVGAVDPKLNELNQPVIQISLPAHFKNSDLETVGEELKKQAQLLKLFNTAFGGTREDIVTLALSSSDLSAYVETGSKFATYFSAVTCFVLTSVNVAMDIRNKHHDYEKLTGKTYKNELFDEIRDSVGKKCAEEISKKILQDDADGVQISIEICSAGATKLFDSILEGTVYDVQIPKTLGSDTSSAEIDNELIQKLLAQSVQIRQEFSLLPRIEYTQKLTHEEGDKE